MTPTEMEMRVATALIEKMGEWHGAEPSQSEAIEYARTAIRAMRDAPKAVLASGECEPDLWNAMIDAASPALPAMKEE